jgi:hypothetical protein
MALKKRAAVKSAKPAAKSMAKIAPKSSAKDISKPASKGMCTTGCCCGCHVLGLFASRVTWASWLLSVIIIVGAQMLLHSQILMQRYIETAGLWLPQSEMNYPYIMIGHVAIATIFTILFRLAYRGWGAVEGLKLGILISSPLAVSMLYVAGTQPIPMDIIQAWAIGYVAMGAVWGLAQAWLLRDTTCCKQC